MPRLELWFEDDGLLDPLVRFVDELPVPRQAGSGKEVGVGSAVESIVYGAASAKNAATGVGDAIFGGEGLRRRVASLRVVKKPS